jgi:hypothetical protein
MPEALDNFKLQVLIRIAELAKIQSGRRGVFTMN